MKLIAQYLSEETEKTPKNFNDTLYHTREKGMCSCVTMGGAVNDGNTNQLGIGPSSWSTNQDVMKKWLDLELLREHPELLEPVLAQMKSLLLENKSVTFLKIHG